MRFSFIAVLLPDTFSSILPLIHIMQRTSMARGGVAVAMQSASRRSLFTLDGIRNKSGIEGLKKVFHEIANESRENAAGLLNAENTQFPTLFALRPEIRKFDLHAHLNTRNKAALEICDEILNGTIQQTYKTRVFDPNSLRWMLETGYSFDGRNERYDEVMDKSALMLTKVCKDKACMQYVAELFFNRNRTGAYTHDLIWAFFEASQPGDLFLIADKLRSHNPKDVEMARSLLNFIPCIAEEKSPLKQHRCAVNWLRHNQRRLQYTGESNQTRHDPQRYELVAPGALNGGAR